MQITFLDVANQKSLIDGVKLHQLAVHRDQRGLLIETLKEDWTEVFKRPEMQFGQSYYSVTLPGFARDENEWHCHSTRQIDRFVVIKGNAVVALYDWRKDSPTHGTLNLFCMGEANGDGNQYLLFIPVNVLHAFCTIGKEQCCLMSYPTITYDPKEEGRVPFSDVNVRFPDGTSFSWDPIRKHFS